MKIRKNLEGVFLVAAAMTILATYATAMPAPRTQHKIQVVAPDVGASLPTIVVHGKRLTEAEKAAEK